MDLIHPTAIVHPQARLAEDVRVGPYAIIDAHVEVGPACAVGPYVYLTGQTTIGKGNVFFAGAVIGEAPQDLKYRGQATGVRIGDNNVFREHTTVHRSAKENEVTRIGSDNFLMAGSHVAHNCTLGNHVILANGAFLGGHVAIHDRAFISGSCLIHQFVTVGTLALMQGGSAISKDLPPFTIARGNNSICGLNTIGLRRAGLSGAERLQLKEVYHLLFRSRLSMADAIAQGCVHFKQGPAATLLAFVASSKRGVCADVGRASNELSDPNTAAES